VPPITTPNTAPNVDGCFGKRNRPLPRLPIVTRPITGETLESYLSRLCTRNALPISAWPLNQRKNPNFIAMLEQLTGHTYRQLVCALPELRTPATLAKFPHLHDTASPGAPRRPACTYCVAAIDGQGKHAMVFATHDQLICRRHHRWLGSGTLVCTAEQQFSLTNCPTIVRANARHRRLIQQWGRADVCWRFDDALTAIRSWARWPIVDHDPGIAQRRKTLNINIERPPLSPRNIASWYPNAIELTSLLLRQTADIKQAGRITLDIVERGIDRISRHVMLNHRPEGARDPYLKALKATPLGSTAEVGLLDSSQHPHIPLASPRQ
jgi:hypothetical protein